MSKKKIEVKIKSKEWDNTYQLLSWWKKEDIENATVAVIGAGALGNEVIKNLTLLGVGNILIIDFDTIEYSNLSRSVLFRPKDSKKQKLKSQIAAERIKEINSNVKVKAINGDVTIDIGLGVFRRVDVIIGCLDNRLARLFLNRIAYKLDKVWIDGAIESLIGQANVYVPGRTCYECSLNKQDWKNIKFKLGCATVAGRNESVGRIPTTPITSSIVAAIQVQEALKIICKYDKKVMLESFYYEGMNNLILQLKAPKLKEDCYSHDTKMEIVETALSSENSIKEVLDWLVNYFDDKEIFIKLENSIAIKIATSESNKSFQLIMPKLKLTDDVLSQYKEVENETVYVIDETDEIDVNFKFQDVSMTQIGISPLDVIRVYSKGKPYHLEMTGDQEYLEFE